MSVLGSKIMRQFSDLIEMRIHKEKNSTTMIHKEPTFPDRQAVVDVGGGLQLQGKAAARGDDLLQAHGRHEDSSYA